MVGLIVLAGAAAPAAADRHGSYGVAGLELNVDEAEQATLDALAAWKGEQCPAKVIVRRKRTPAAPPKARAKVKKAYPAKPKQAQQAPTHDIETDTVHRLLRPAR